MKVKTKFSVPRTLKYVRVLNASMEENPNRIFKDRFFYGFSIRWLDQVYNFVSAFNAWMHNRGQRQRGEVNIVRQQPRLNHSESSICIFNESGRRAFTKNFEWRFKRNHVFRGGNLQFARSFNPNSRAFLVDEHFQGVSSNLGLLFGRADQVIGLPPSTLHLRELTLHHGQLPRGNTAVAPHFVALPPHLASLAAINQPSEKHYNQLQDPDDSEHPCKYLYPPLYVYVLGLGICVGTVSLGGWLAGGNRISWRRLGWCLGFIGVFGGGCILSTAAFGNPLFLWSLQWVGGKGHRDNCKGEYQGISVTQKYLTVPSYCNTVIGMANVLPKDKQIAVIGALAEGSSIRSIERLTGIHRDTVMRLGVRVGIGCQMLMDSKMQDLNCRYLQFDEVWGFIGKKERHVRVDDNPELGDAWTFCAVDAETKLVPCFKVGKRDHVTANAFVQDVANRMKNRVQISTDALRQYVEAIEQSFGSDVDYGQIVKVYVHDSAQHPERKYSAPHFASAIRRPIAGSPDMDLVSTSYIERLNATTRLHVKRLSRLTLAFSKKLENFQAAVGLHFAYYNFVRRHNTLRCTSCDGCGCRTRLLDGG